ncbi:MAG TPA: YHS domain-containing protein [Syntrophales bacterium]|nr:YHS domain-containing protein [Syntrophales bacterium]
MARYCVDPVCKCNVDEEESKHSSIHKDKEVHFCSVECKEEFDKNPLEYMAENLRTGA